MSVHVFPVLTKLSNAYVISVCCNFWVCQLDKWMFRSWCNCSVPQHCSSNIVLSIPVCWWDWSAMYHKYFNFILSDKPCQVLLLYLPTMPYHNMVFVSDTPTIVTYKLKTYSLLRLSYMFLWIFPSLTGYLYLYLSMFRLLELIKSVILVNLLHIFLWENRVVLEL